MKPIPVLFISPYRIHFWFRTKIVRHHLSQQYAARHRLVLE